VTLSARISTEISGGGESIDGRHHHHHHVRLLKTMTKRIAKIDKKR